MRRLIKILHITCISIGLCFFAYILLLVFLFPKSYTKDLGGGYEYDYLCQKFISGPKITITDEILNFAFDNQFIIVRQNLNGQTPYGYGYKDPNSGFPSRYGDYYWIIDKNEQNYYGPMRLAKFTMMCDSLNVEAVLNPRHFKNF